MRHVAWMAAAVVAALLAVQASAGTWHDDFEGGDLSDWKQFTDPQGADDPTQGVWEERKRRRHRHRHGRSSRRHTYQLSAAQTARCGHRPGGPTTPFGRAPEWTPEFRTAN